MKRIITAATNNYSDTVFVSPQDYKKYFSSLVTFIYKYTHLYISRGFTETIKVFRYDGDYISEIDGKRYIVLVYSNRRVLTEKYFDTKYVALDAKKVEEYYKLANEFEQWYKNNVGRFVDNSTKDDIIQWLADNNISDFSANADA